MPKDDLDLQEAVDLVKSLKGDFETFKEKNDGHLEEVKKGFDDVVRREELDRINEALSDADEKLEKFAIRQKRLMEAGGEPKTEEMEQKAALWGRTEANAYGAEGKSDYSVEEMKEYQKHLLRYFRKGEKVLDSDEFKALSVGGDPDGGYVVYPDMSGRLVMRVYETSPVRQYASVTTISTDALEGLHDVDEASVGWVGETATRSETDTPELDRWRIPVHEIYAKPHATQKILDDAAIDIEGWLADKVAERIARAENDTFLNGSGTNKPRGFLTYSDYTAAGVDEIGAIEQFDTGAAGDFAADPNGPDVLYDCIYGLKAPYRANAIWMMNRTTTGRVRKMQDSNGMYMWQPSVQAGQPATLAGYPVASFEDMPDYSTDGNLGVAFGDLGAAYQIVDRQGIRILRDPYSSKPYVQFYTTKRVGGDVVNFEAIKLINFQS